jgi:hypothetical protein
LPRAAKNDISEIFGHAPDDVSAAANSFWTKGLCPFTQNDCIKWNHDKTVLYGVCSVTAGGSKAKKQQSVIICPNRLYAHRFGPIQSVAQSAFPGAAFFLHSHYLKHRQQGRLPNEFSVAVGKGSGGEVSITGGGRVNLDWVIARVKHGQLEEFVAAEVQSIDTTGNYRACWNAYSQLRHVQGGQPYIPNSEHGLNWANVHKRLIPQLIRKGTSLHVSPRCSGIYFIVPDLVYKEFEKIMHKTTLQPTGGRGLLTVMTYELNSNVSQSQIRGLQLVRTEHVALNEFAANFVAGGELPSPADIEQRIMSALQ